MKHLSKLTPAETLILQQGDRAPFSDVLKYTLMDLLLKQVLTVEEIHRQSNSHDPVRVYKYVTHGKNFNHYSFKFHELVFLSVFQENTTIKILFKNLVKVGYQKAKSPTTFYPSLIASTDLKEAFSRSLYQRLFGGFKHTRKGTQFQNEVQREIRELENTFPDFFTENRIRGIETLKAIGGNIFLLKRLDFALAAEIDKELFEEMAKQNAGGGSSSGCWVCFDDYSGTFDDSSSSDSGTGGHGESGCSGGGCSGDSGCGGCGGD